jgi:hypothetical protein
MDSVVLTAVVVGASGRLSEEAGDKMAWTAKVAEAGGRAMGGKCPSALTGAAKVDGEARQPRPTHPALEREPIQQVGLSIILRTAGVDPSVAA